MKTVTSAGYRARCHYASKPSLRPACQHIAVIRYGKIALCANCDSERSTVGKGVKGIRL